MPGWRLASGGARFNKNLRIKSGTTGVGVNSDILANDPRYQAQLRSTWEGSNNALLEVSLRHVAKLSTQAIPAYTAVDAHYAWQIDRQLELSVTGKNLLDKRHREFGNSVSVNDIQRMFYLALTWRQ